MDHRRELPVRRLQRNLAQRVCYKKKNSQTDSKPLVIDLSRIRSIKIYVPTRLLLTPKRGFDYYYYYYYYKATMQLSPPVHDSLFGLLTSTGNGLQNEKDDDLRIHAMGVDSITTP